MDIVCVSETWFSIDIIDSVYNLPGFKLYRSDRRIMINGIGNKARVGGVAIFVRCSISCALKMQSKAGSEIIPKNKSRILVGSVYRSRRGLVGSVLAY